MNLETELAQVKSKIEKIKVQKIENETNLKRLEEEKKELLKECDKLGVDPKKLSEIIKEKESLIQKDLEEVTKQLRSLNGNGSSGTF